MSKISNDIINLISSNRISSVEVADALNKTGVVDGLRILNNLKYAVGKVEYIYSFNESNWPLHEQIKDVKEDSILFVDCIDCKNRAVLGDIVAKYLFVYKKIRGLVINGLVRDLHRLKKEDYPIWYRGETPLGCFNKKVNLSTEQKKLIKERQKLYNGSIMVCDDSGCTLISKDNISNKTLSNLEMMELQEDIWYFCIDTLKWSTFDTICLKKYLKNKNILPENIKKKLEIFEEEQNK